MPWLALAALLLQDTAYRVTVEVHTTSDWTEVSFEGADADCLMHLRNPSRQPLSKSFTCRVFVTGKPRLVITKGDLGATRVKIEGVIDHNHDRNIENDPTNRVVLEIDLSACPQEQVRRPQYPPTVLAFYYPWYGNPEGPSRKWFHWNSASERRDSTHTPELGWYDSKDEKTIAQHIDWARQAGIDGFISSWWGPGSFEDEALASLVKVCEKKEFKLTIYYEDCRDWKQLRGDIESLISKYGTSKAWLRVEDRPVFFIYGRVMGKIRDFKPAFEGLKAAFIADSLDPAHLSVFDGLHTYNCAGWVEGYKKTLERAARIGRAQGKIVCATVIPGYDDTVIRKPGLKEDRRDGKLFEELWQAAAGATWVLITSWNEWHEGSEIEPSKEFGRKYLDLCRRLGEAWRR